jgi:hypothetical protein
MTMSLPRTGRLSPLPRDARPIGGATETASSSCWAGVESWANLTVPSGLAPDSKRRHRSALASGVVVRRRRAYRAGRCLSGHRSPVAGPRARAPCVEWPRRQHTARYQAWNATIHYPFHTRCGEQVGIVRRHSFHGVSMLVIQQPDGTLAQVPEWMTAPKSISGTRR